MSFAARRSASAAARSLKKGGVAERLRRCREASADREAGVVFRWRTKPQGGRKTTPTASTSVASQHFLDDAATPPCSDARRGIRSIPIRSHLLERPRLVDSKTGAHRALPLISEVVCSKNLP